jgi:hypothetical protein
MLAIWKLVTGLYLEILVFSLYDGRARFAVGDGRRHRGYAKQLTIYGEHNCVWPTRKGSPSSVAELTEYHRRSKRLTCYWKMQKASASGRQLNLRNSQFAKNFLNIRVTVKFLKKGYAQYIWLAKGTVALTFSRLLVMWSTNRFNIQEFLHYATLYWCVLFLSHNK